jgi:DcuC family C4-dicarboxylate transporter
MILAIGLPLAALSTFAAGYALVKGRQPQWILLSTGLAMLFVAWILGNPAEASTGWQGFDLFDLITLSLKSKAGGIGVMIMVIAGFVAYMEHMGATETLVRLAIRPIQVLRRTPNLAAILVLPLGQLLSLCVPSAAGLGLLMIASVHPILLRIGLTPVASVSIITLCTCFDMGPASANTARASELLGMDNVTYFLEHQLLLAGSFTLVIMAIVYIQLRFKPGVAIGEGVNEPDPDGKMSPAHFAILPVLPLILLTIFSEFFQTGPHPILLDTSTAMLISLAIAMLVHRLSGARGLEIEAGLKLCWDGMGRALASIVTLIVSADIFAKGLIHLGLIEGLLALGDGLGWGALAILFLFVGLIFLASILMGSGNASFFAFGPLIPGIAKSLGVPGIKMLLPMQLASSMGRAASPIAGVVIATSGIAGVDPMQVAKRNALPMGVALTLMILTEILLQ